VRLEICSIEAWQQLWPSRPFLSSFAPVFHRRGPRSPIIISLMLKSAGECAGETRSRTSRRLNGHSADRGEECADIVDEQHRFLEWREVSSAWHLVHPVISPVKVIEPVLS
jgi:hypothetical protein